MKDHNSPNWMPFESYPVALYDMSIEDVKERFASRQVFAKAIMAANFLGIVPNQFFTIINSKNGHKYAYHRETRKKYAVRKLTNQTV